MASSAGRIRVGIGGWNFEPWRETFYPKHVTQKKELEYASRQLTSIEINGTYYGSQSPQSFARWHDDTPEDFVFSVKGPRFATNRKDLALSAESVERFLAGGILELKDKLGPINWQFLPTKQFDAGNFESFLKLLPTERGGCKLRHVVEVRHASFAVPAFIDLARQYNVAIAYTDHPDFPQIADVTTSFVYARLQNASEKLKTGYSPSALEAWAARAKHLSHGHAVDELPRVAKAGAASAKSRDVFIYIINGFKPKAPAAAMALIKQLSDDTT